MRNGNNSYSKGWLSLRATMPPVGRQMALVIYALVALVAVWASYEFNAGQQIVAHMERHPEAFRGGLGLFLYYFLLANFGPALVLYFLACFLPLNFTIKFVFSGVVIVGAHLLFAPTILHALQASLLVAPFAIPLLFITRQLFNEPTKEECA